MKNKQFINGKPCLLDGTPCSYTELVRQERYICVVNESGRYPDNVMIYVAHKDRIYEEAKSYGQRREAQQFRQKAKIQRRDKYSLFQGPEKFYSRTERVRKVKARGLHLKPYLFSSTIFTFSRGKLTRFFGMRVIWTDCIEEDEIICTYNGR